MAIQWGDGGEPAGTTVVVGHIPSLAARFRIGIRVFFGGCGGSSEPRFELDPHLLYLYVLCDRGPPTS